MGEDEKGCSAQDCQVLLNQVLTRLSHFETLQENLVKQLVDIITSRDMIPLKSHYYILGTAVGIVASAQAITALLK